MQFAFFISFAIIASGAFSVPALAQSTTPSTSASSTTAATTKIPGTIYSTSTTPDTPLTVLLIILVILLAGAGMLLLSVNPFRSLSYLHMEDIRSAA